VRHLYDLHVICTHYDPAEVAALAREIRPYDAEAFGNQLPAYRVNPMAERLWAIEALQLDPGHARRYTDYSVHGYAGRIEGNSSTKATNDTDARDMELA
jgi:hypothetical protein